MKSLAHPEVYERARPLVIGDAPRLREAGTLVHSSLQVECLEPDAIADGALQPGVVDCIDLRALPSGMAWGEPVSGSGPRGLPLYPGRNRASL